ncbi:MAG: STAS domain-containing protein [Spirochaetaceae bacterium]|nr:STAS domain-containing protein [Spirochaetaceae bacterium]
MENENLEITKDETPGSAKITVKGHINSITASALKKELEEALKDGQISIVLNMSMVDYLCSTGIEVILNTYKDAMDAGGTVGIEEPSEHVRNLLQIIALEELVIR